jgi:hypothetical protein
MSTHSHCPLKLIKKKLLPQQCLPNIGAGNEHTGFDIKQLSDCPGQVKTALNLSNRASENDSVTCSIPEEQND